MQSFGLAANSRRRFQHPSPGTSGRNAHSPAFTSTEGCAPLPAMIPVFEAYLEFAPCLGICVGSTEGELVVVDSRSSLQVALGLASGVQHYRVGGRALEAG